VNKLGHSAVRITPALRGRPPWPRLKELADAGSIEPALVSEAIERYHIDPDAPIPSSV